MKIICSNKKTRFNFEIISQLEVGIVLKGSEVKSLREATGISIVESYVKIINNEVFLVGATIPPYAGSKENWNGHEPTRQRKLLLHRKEIKKLESELISGFSIVPLDLHYNQFNLIKVTIALCKGKKLHDKREAQKEKDFKRYQD